MQIQIFIRSPVRSSFCSTYTCACFENCLVSVMALVIQSGVSFQVIPVNQITTFFYFHEKAFTSIYYLFHENLYSRTVLLKLKCAKTDEKYRGRSLSTVRQKHWGLWEDGRCSLFKWGSFQLHTSKTKRTHSRVPLVKCFFVVVLFKQRRNTKFKVRFPNF